jgi:hypothetical protein
MQTIVAGKAVRETPVDRDSSKPTIVGVIVVPTPVPQGSELVLGSLQSPEYRLLRPIPLALSSKAGSAVLTWEEANIKVKAANLGEALARFQAMLVEIARTSSNEVVARFVERTTQG